MQRRLVLACVLVAVVLLTAGALAGPLTDGDGPAVAAPAGPSGDAANGTTSTPPTTAESNSSDDAPAVGDAVANHTGDRFAVSALAQTDDGATVVAGATGLRASNATVLRVGADGEREWTYEYASANRSAVAATAPAADGGAYVVQTEREPPRNGSYSSEVGVALVHVDADGDRAWKRSVNTSGYVGRGLALADADGGVAVVHALESGGVRLAQFDADGDVAFERTYGVDATPTALRATDDGFVAAGTVSIGEPWVVRTDEAGAPQFNETFENYDTEGVTGVVPTDDGGVVIAGWHRGGSVGFEPTPWAARLDDDGVPVWERAYATNARTQVRDVLAADDGVVLVGTDRNEWGADRPVRFVGVAGDGDERFQTTVRSDARLSAAAGDGDAATVATLGYAEPNASSSVRTVELPEDATVSGPDADAAPSSNESVYRGQALAFESPDGDAGAYDLVALPGEYDDFDPHVERRVEFGDDGTAVVDSATLPAGEYVFEAPDGDRLAVEDGALTAVAGNETAAFTVERHDFRRAHVSQSFVDAADGDGEVTVSTASRRSNYSVYVSAERFRGDAPSAAELRNAFADAAGFAGVETVDGRPVARLDLGPTNEVGGDGYTRWDQEFGVDAAAFDAGLYRLRVASVDTRTAGAVATTRLVVGKTADEPLDVSLAEENLTVAVGNETGTNVTVSGLSDGVGAISMSAERTGEPAVSLGIRADVDGSRGEGSGSWSSCESTASAAEFDGNTTAGTVPVGELTVRATDRVAVDGTATNTVTFGLDWVVDENGTPYAIPGEETLTVEVTGDETESGDG